MGDYTLKKGDRIKFSGEGVVTWAHGPDISVAACDAPDSPRHVLWRQHLSIEKLPDPIPITPGTVLWIINSAYQRCGSAWQVTGSPDTWTDDEMQGKADRLGFTVLREGRR